jgi:hypothetical protein
MQTKQRALMSNQDLIVADNNRQMQRLEHKGMPAEDIVELRRVEMEIDDALDTRDQAGNRTAFALKAANDIYAKAGNNQYTAETFKDFVEQWAWRGLTLDNATRAVQFAKMLIEDLGPTQVLPAAIEQASDRVKIEYLRSHDDVKRDIEEGVIPPNRDKIREANLIAQKAETRSRELEVALAKAVDELAKIEATREQAEKTLEFALMESENARLKLAEQEREMKARIAEATAAERDRLENSYKAALYRAETDLKKTREEAERNLKRANTDLAQARKLSQDLTERLKVSRDRGAIWTRWEINSVKFAKQIEQIIAELPPEEEMVVYEQGHWQLLEDMVKRVDNLSAIIHNRLDRHSRGEGIVVEAD